MWDDIINSNTERGAAIREALNPGSRSDGDFMAIEVTNRPRIVFPSPMQYGRQPGKVSDSTTESRRMRTWDDIREQAKSDAIGKVPEEETFKSV